MSAPPSQPPYPQSPHAGAAQQQQQQQQVPGPQLPPAQQQLEDALKSLYDSLTVLQTQAGSVAPGCEALVSQSAADTIANLSRLSLMKPSIEGGVHPKVLELVEQDKNPHAFTRDTLERASGENQFANGKLQALSSYTELLDAELETAFPELEGILRPSSGVAPGMGPAGGVNGTEASPAPPLGPPQEGNAKMDWAS